MAARRSLRYLSKVVSFDLVSGHRFSSQYAYHHGYYDISEREFRGFGCVETTDTDDFEQYAATANGTDPFLHQAPVLTRTWYHLGAWIKDKEILEHYATEYHPVYADEPRLTPPVLGSTWNPVEQREALRAFKGKALRQEVYAQDGSVLADKPFSTTQTSYAICQLQAQGDNRHGCFHVTQSESLTHHYERALDDPRVAHTLVLQADGYGRPELAASVVYARKAGKSSGISTVDAEQGGSHILITATQYADDASDLDCFRMGLECAVRTWEFTNPQTPSVLYTALWFNTELPLASEIPFETTPSTSMAQIRLVEQTETLFLAEDLSAPLPAGSMASHGLPYESYTLAYLQMVEFHRHLSLQSGLRIKDGLRRRQIKDL